MECTAGRLRTSSISSSVENCIIMPFYLGKTNTTKTYYLLNAVIDIRGWDWQQNNMSQCSALKRSMSLIIHRLAPFFNPYQTFIKRKEKSRNEKETRDLTQITGLQGFTY